MNIIIIGMLNFIFGWMITRGAISLNILDVPNYRKIHSNPIPKAGGLGIIIPIIFTLCYYLFTANNLDIKLHQQLIILFCTIVLLIMGLIDDKIELSAKTKLAVQCLVALILIYSGFRLDLFSSTIINGMITFIWIIGFVNALNLIDGLDGLAAGIGIIACLGMFYFGFIYHFLFIEMMAIAIIGSSLGFLIYNHHPAKIFMGDTGSMPLGFLLAVLVILLSNKIGSLGGARVVGFLVLVPIYDTLLSMTRRKLHGKPLFKPDRSHFYNLIMDKKNVSHQNTVYIIYAINLVCLGLSMLMEYTNTRVRTFIFIGSFVLMILGTIKFDFLKVDSEQE